MSQEFSNLNRVELLQSLEKDHYDLIVIGGGITGAGILLDAASRGLKALLLEKGDFASGTSSKSTKLIHGGLRYLKQFDLSLVREVGSERAIVHRMAPHLVIPEKMLLPLIENGTYNKWLTSLGLKVYDLLANVAPNDQRRMLEKGETLEKEPLLPADRVKGGGYYAEYRTDDARLTLENIKSALEFGAMAMNYISVNGFKYTNQKISGVKALDHSSGRTLDFRAHYVINATGPWVDELRTLNHSKNGKELHLTKGVHLVFPHEKLPISQSIYFDAPDGRMIFAIPRDRITYVGTTDTTYTESKDHITTNKEDAAYLLKAVNAMFPLIHLEHKDIISSWAGLRPLIHEEGKSPSELSRKDEIFISDSGLISIAGGKLTGYRKMAERIVNKVSKKMKEDQGRSLKPCLTHTLSLCGGPWKEGFAEVTAYIEDLTELLQSDGLTEYHARYLVHTYGKQTTDILRNYRQQEEGKPEERLIRAEYLYSASQEMILDPMDFFIRRTGHLYFRISIMRAYMEVILSDHARLFGKSPGEINTLRQKLKDTITEHSDF